MSERELKFERKLAMHTAPTLLGIKCAGLLSLSMDEFDVEAHLEFFNRRAVSRGLKIKQLCCCKNRALILLYSEKLMEKRLSDCTAKQLLAGYGYGEDLSLDECLDRLSERICEHGDFPHEIGVFLGYPFEDVKGFIENNGGNFKLCGCWKVYGNVEAAERTFANYGRCRKFLCNKLNQGIVFYQALRIS